MPLSTTTHMLYAEIDHWSHTRDCEPEGRFVPLLRLAGTTVAPFADCEQPLPLGLTLLVVGREGEDAPDEPWQLNLIDELGAYDLPIQLEGVLTLSPAQLSEVKAELLRAARLPGLSVQVRLEARERLADDNHPGSGRSFALLAFGFDLQYQKESPCN